MGKRPEDFFDELLAYAFVLENSSDAGCGDRAFTGASGPPREPGKQP